MTYAERAEDLIKRCTIPPIARTLFPFNDLLEFVLDMAREVDRLDARIAELERE